LSKKDEESIKLTEAEEVALKRLKTYFAQSVPDSAKITHLAIQETLSASVEKDWIKLNFSMLVEQLQVDAYNMYLDLEKKAWQQSFIGAFGPELIGCKGPEDVSAVIGRHFYTLDRFFLSRTQSRRSRAGTAFEVVLSHLFTQLGYPFTSQPRIDGKPDFVMPSVKYYNQNAQDAIVFTAKRSLRERWRQVVTEGARGLGFYLATIDEQVSEAAIKEMKTSRIQLVVPTRIKKSVPHYSEAMNVISFEDFLEDKLDPRMMTWKKHGILG
jgi:hypothetical protein